jgi:hypothetical protein
MKTSHIKYYDLENYVLTDVRDSFDRNGHLTAFDFFCIVIWKANRAKTKIAQRLLNYNSDIEQSVKDLTSKIFSATDDKQKLKVLITDYKFRANSTYKKLAVQWLNEALCFVSSFVVADSLVLRNRQLLVAAKPLEKGHEELQLIMKTVMTKFTADTTLLIQGVKGKINEQGHITDNKTKDDLTKFIKAFKRLTETVCC